MSGILFFIFASCHPLILPKPTRIRHFSFMYVLYILHDARVSYLEPNLYSSFTWPQSRVLEVKRSNRPAVVWCDSGHEQTTIIERISWDAWSILVVVFLTASANFRQRFWNNNVHVAWTLQPISLPYPHQTMLRGPTRKLTTWLLSTLYGGGGANSSTAIKSPQLFSMIVASM